MTTGNDVTVSSRGILPRSARSRSNSNRMVLPHHSRYRDRIQAQEYVIDARRQGIWQGIAGHLPLSLDRTSQEGADQASSSKGMRWMQMSK